MNPLASLIILNLNGERFLKDCFESLRGQTFKNFEIIFVDNGSADQSVLWVEKNYKEVKIIRNKANLGFAKANNQGFELARGKYIITLNNDTRVEKSWLENLIFAAEKNELVGMCASKIISMDGSGRIDSTGVNMCLDGMSRGRGRMEKDVGQYDDCEDIFMPSACAALYRKKMLDEIGFFDGDFFAYCEDSDLGLRGRLAGWKAIFVPSAVVYHYYSGTTGKYSPLKAYLVERNHIWLVVKNFPLELLFLSPFLTLYRFILQFYAVLAKRGASFQFVKQGSVFAAAGTIFKAYFDVFKKLPEFIKKRGIIQKNKKLSRSDFYSLLKKHKLTFKELVFKK